MNYLALKQQCEDMCYPPAMACGKCEIMRVINYSLYGLSQSVTAEPVWGAAATIRSASLP